MLYGDSVVLLNSSMVAHDNDIKRTSNKNKESNIQYSFTMMFALSNPGLLESLRINVNRDMLLFWFLCVALYLLLRVHHKLYSTKKVVCTHIFLSEYEVTKKLL